MDGLKGFEFPQYFAKIPIVQQQFVNVFAIDEIPKVIPIRHFLISNLSPAHLSGSHWIVLVRPDKHTLEIFNSLGGDTYNDIKTNLRFTSRLEIHTNNTSFQSSNSTSCGYFCIYFAVNRILNLDMSFEHLLEHLFTHDTESNDNNVTRFCENLLQSTDDTEIFL
jgi:hypothetical protein